MSFFSSISKEGEGGKEKGREEERKGRDSYVSGFHSEEN